MMKMRILLDEQKIRSEGKYNYDKMVEVLDETFEELELYRIRDGSEILTYCGTDSPHDFAHFGVMFNSLRKKGWFVDNALLWELHEPLDFYDIEIESIEDLLVGCKDHL